MVDTLEKLLVLQERDRSISRTRAELNNIGPERSALESKLSVAQKSLEEARMKVKQLEAEKGKLELEVESKHQQISKYALQQFQTKKNEEYQALTKEIGGCKAAITELEDHQLEIMERIEAAQKEVGSAAKETETAKKDIEGQIAALGERETKLKERLGELQADYEQLTAPIDPDLYSRYDRLRKHKGDNAVVGIEHSVCGGCHMRLPAQVIVACRGKRDVVNCTNCGRILYFNSEMDLAARD